MNHPHPDANCRFASAANKSATTDQPHTAGRPLDAGQVDAWVK